MSRHDRLDTFAVATLALMCVLLGVGQVAMKVANGGISPILQAGMRSGAAAILLALWCLWRGIPIIKRDGIMAPGLVAALFFTLEFALLYPGLDRTTAARAVILLYTSPLVVALGAHWLIPGDRLTVTKIAGLLLAFGGVAVVLSGHGSGGGSLTGDLLCLAAGVSWGGITLTVRASRLAQIAAERVTLFQLAMSAVALSAISMAVGERGIFAPTLLVIAAFLYSVVFVAFIAFTVCFWLLTIYPASKVMAFLMLTPLFGVAAGALLLGEPLTWHIIAGLALVLPGLWLVNRPSR